MNFIVVYDRKQRGNPIVAIHTQRFATADITLEDIHPGDDPTSRGVVIVPGEVLHNSVLRTYKNDSLGHPVMQPVLLERAKDLVSVADSALGQNVLVFGEPYVGIKDLTDLGGNNVGFTAVNPERGIIGIGTASGHFTVTCRVDTGTRAPEILREEKNWEWARDPKGNITGMKLLKAAPSDPQRPRYAGTL